MKNDTLKIIIDLFIYLLLLPFVGISFILTNLTNDTRIFLGASSVANNYYQLPFGWDAAYEVKPIGNRILNWVFYKVADTFVPMIHNYYVPFGWFVKFTALVILVICCLYIASRIKFPYAFPILFCAFACQANFGIMMSEWFSVLFSLVAVAMCFEKNKNWMILAGVIMLGVGLLKSITVLMVIPSICAVYMLGGTIEWKRAIGGYLAAGFAFLALCFTVWPYSIGDMIMSRLIAHAGMYGFKTMATYFWITQNEILWGLPVVMSMYIPILVVGFLAALWCLGKYIVKKDNRMILLIIGIWIIPIIIVFVQSEYIVYHYIVCVLPAIVSLILLLRSSRRKYQFLAASAVYVLMGYLLINSAFGSFTLYEYTFWHQKETNADLINSKFDLINQSSILYLDPGDAVYYFHANSSCHYITPMPVERNDYVKWNISYLPQFKETKDCILRYQGEYIISDINNGDGKDYYGYGIINEPEIMDMIHRNYTMVESLSWEIYQKR